MLNVNKKWSLPEDKLVLPLAMVIGLADFCLQTFLRYRGWGVPNNGVSFGMFSNLGIWLQFFLVLVFLSIAFFLLAGHKKIWVSLLVILIGGSVNLGQRLVFGNVWDYIKIPLMPFTNNLSDILIFLGVVINIYGK